MTTPARNVNQLTLVSSTIRERTFPPESGWRERGKTNVFGRHVIDIRPPSGNAPRSGGLLLCRPFDHLIGNFSRVPTLDGVWNHEALNNQWGVTYDMGGFWGSASPPTTALDPTPNMANRVIISALDALKRQDLHLGNFIVEFHKTSSMVKRAATSIAQQVRRYRKRYPKEWLLVVANQTGNLPRHLWCTIPDSWLELQYGWKPLMSDTQGAINHLYKVAKGRLPIVTVSRRFGDDVIVSEQVQSTVGGITATVRWRHHREVTCFLMYEVTAPTLAELSSLGLINPAEIIWEVTKYSFVVDWFLPIGQWLSAMTADVGMTFRSGGLTRFSKCTFEGSSVYQRPPKVDLIGGAPRFQGQLVKFDRKCFDGTPFPGLYVKNPLSGMHVANALALLAQAFH